MSSLPKKIALALGALLIILVLIAGGWVFYEEVLSYETLDLTPLEPYAATEHYDELIARVKAQPIGPEGFKFVVLGDSRTNYGKALEVLTRAADEDPAFILSNGDIVRKGTPGEYIAHHLRLVEAVKPVPFIPVPGNHERGPNRDFATFKAIYGDTRLSFDYGNIRIVGVNNGDRLGMSNSDINFLRDELSKPGVDHKFVIFHVPPRYMEDYGTNEEGRGFTWNHRKFRRLVTDQAVDHVFVGHVHGFYTRVIDGIRYTITGGAGASLSQALDPEGQVHNYIVVHVRPEGLEVEVVKEVEGQWVRAPIE
jgi:3',5'-cyclic AMP phosphodiesterase CpdA